MTTASVVTSSSRPCHNSGNITHFNYDVFTHDRKAHMACKVVV